MSFLSNLVTTPAQYESSPIEDFHCIDCSSKVDRSISYRTNDSSLLRTRNPIQVKRTKQIVLILDLFVDTVKADYAKALKLSAF